MLYWRIKWVRIRYGTFFREKLPILYLTKVIYDLMLIQASTSLNFGNIFVAIQDIETNPLRNVNNPGLKSWRTGYTEFLSFNYGTQLTKHVRAMKGKMISTS
jgi:hypothetical protein